VTPRADQETHTQLKTRIKLKILTAISSNIQLSLTTYLKKPYIRFWN